MSEATKVKLFWAGLAATIVFLAFFNPHTATWDGDGTVNIFPSSVEAKNYRLDATMSVTRKWHGWFRSNGTLAYTGITATWPDSGTLDLKGCVVIDTGRANCVGNDGKPYAVEVVLAPDEPEAESSSD